MESSKFFYCYSPFLRKHIESLGIESVLAGVNDKTNSRYKVYERTEELSEAIDSYKNQRK